MTIRSDAVRNRTELLEAAERVIPDLGLGAEYKQIAVEAGVGRATLYRHFPTRQDLVVALLERSLGRLEAHVAQHLESDGLRSIFQFFAERAREQAALASFLEVMDNTDPKLIEIRERFRSIIAPTLDRAITAGVCRQDLTVEDVRTLMVMLISIVSRSEDQGAMVPPARILQLMFDGILR